jgi:hypothetical protein
LTDLEFNSSLYLANENESAAPTINRKNGKTRSVGVQPAHAACLRGGNILLQEPGLLTRIIPAIVIPLKTSRAVYLWVVEVVIFLVL